MGIQCRLITPLLVEHKFTRVITLLVKNVRQASGIFGVGRCDQLRRESAKGLKSLRLERHVKQASNHRMVHLLSLALWTGLLQLHVSNRLEEDEKQDAAQVYHLQQVTRLASQLSRAVILHVTRYGVDGRGPTASIQPRRRMDRYRCKHKTSFQNRSDLGAAQRRRLECVVGRRPWRSKALHLRLLWSIEGGMAIALWYQWGDANCTSHTVALSSA
jgi:hypothetical protein